MGAKKPNVGSLVRERDEFGLAEAAGYVPPDGTRAGAIETAARIRQEAVLALGALGPDAGVQAVAWALRDPVEGVRLAAIRVMRSRGQSAALAAALAWLDRGGEAHRRAIDAILEIQTVREAGEAGVARLVSGALVNAADAEPLTEEAPELVQMLLGAEGENELPGIVSDLITALGSGRDVVADRAELLLVRLAPQSVPELIAALETGVAPRRAARALAQVRDLSALDTLAWGVEHPDARVRAECVVGLGELRHPGAVAALLQAGRDPDYDVRVKAGAALDALGSIGIVAGMATLLAEAPALS